MKEEFLKRYRNGYILTPNLFFYMIYDLCKKNNIKGFSLKILQKSMNIINDDVIKLLYDNLDKVGFVTYPAESFQVKDINCGLFKLCQIKEHNGEDCIIMTKKSNEEYEALNGDTILNNIAKNESNLISDEIYKIYKIKRQKNDEIERNM